MKREDYDYTYELHFPMTKEVFYSNKEPELFMEGFNSPNGVENIYGDIVIMVRTGSNNIGNMICYLKQLDNNKEFRF